MSRSYFRLVASDHADIAKYVERVAAAIISSSGDRAVLRRLQADLNRVARAEPPGTYQRGFVDSLRKIVQAAAELADGREGLAAQSAAFEPGSLPARMLIEIAQGVRGANADLAERLDTDQWQISRAGRRLRELGLAERTRAGRLNGWSLTSEGERQASRS